MITFDPGSSEIALDRGDDQPATLTVILRSGLYLALVPGEALQSGDVAQNVTAGTFKFTVKFSLDDVIGSAKFQKTSPAANGIDLTDAATGKIVVNFIPSDTQALAAGYYYDLEMVLAGKTRTLRAGRFTVTKDVSTPGVAGQPAGIVDDFGADGLRTDVIYLRNPATGSWIKLTHTPDGVLDIGPASAGPPPY